MTTENPEHITPRKTRQLSEKRKLAYQRRQEKSIERGIYYLAAFIQKHGHCRVPVAHIQDKFPLGRWIANIRAKYKRGEMDQRSIAALEAIDSWSWSAWNNEWERNFELLTRFHAREGHIRVPIDHIEEDSRLGSWIARQRVKSNSGKLEYERLARLRDFEQWDSDWRESFCQRTWDEKVQALKTFCAREGHSRIPREHMEGDVKLGVWANSVRSQKNSGTLEPERIKELEHINNWQWARSRIEQREQGLKSLSDFISKNGNSTIEINYIDSNGFPLGKWVSKQRVAHARGVLSTSMIDALNAIEGWQWKRPSKKQAK